MQAIKHDAIETSVSGARDWLNHEETMGAPADVLEAFESLEEAVEAEDADDIVEASERLLHELEGDHPTRRDILGSPAKQAIYVITGQRHHER